MCRRTPRHIPVAKLPELIKYGTEPVPDTIQVVHPAWRTLDSQIRSLTAKRSRLLAEFGAQALDQPLSNRKVDRYQQGKGQLREEIDAFSRQIDELRQKRKQTEHHVPVKELSENDRFTRLRTERKHFIDTIKMISYQAETSMASLPRENLPRSEDARVLLHQIYDTEADLLPDTDAKTLTVRFHHLTQATHDLALQKLCGQLNTTETVFPGTDLRRVFKVGSN